MDVEQNDHLLFNRIAENYAAKDIALSSRLAREYRLRHLLNLLPTKSIGLGTILEIGCGVGATAKYLQGYYRRYIGVDQSENLIQKAKEYNQDNNQAEFICLNVKKLGTESAYMKSADTIFSLGVLHHMTDLDEVFNVLGKVAKPGAFFVASEPYKSNFFIHFLRHVRMIIDKDYSKDQKFFSESELLEIAKRNGLVLDRLTYQGFFSTPFTQVIIRPQIIGAQLSKLAIFLDKILDKCCVRLFKKFSWCIVIVAKFPE